MMLMVLLMAVKRQVVAVGGEYGLSNVQTIIVGYIIPDEGCTMRKLSSIMGCDASNITGIVDGLESKGIVSRHSMPGDRRVKVLQFEPYGKKVQNDIVKRAADYIQKELIAKVTRQEAVQLTEIVAKLVGNDFMLPEEDL